MSSFLYFIELEKDRETTHYIVTVRKGNMNGPVIAVFDTGTNIHLAIQTIEEIRLRINDQISKLLNYTDYYRN